MYLFRSLLLTLLLLLNTSLFLVSAQQLPSYLMPSSNSFLNLQDPTHILQGAPVPTETTDEPIIPPDQEESEAEDQPSSEETNTTSASNSTNSEDSQIIVPTNDAISQDKSFPFLKGFWVSLAGALGLVCLSGFISGLTVGFMSLDDTQVENKLKNGTDEEKRDAAIVLPLLTKNYQILSILLILNAIIQATLPVVLGTVVITWAAVAIAAFIVVIFGDILPQACCADGKQLKFISKMAVVLKFLLLFYFITSPLACLLEYFLGSQNRNKLLKKDLKALVELQEMSKHQKVQSVASKESICDNLEQKNLSAVEMKKVNATIDLRDSPLTNQMKPIDQVFMLSSRTKINKDVVKRIAKTKFSNIPIYENYEKNKILGILESKSLLDYQDNWEGQTIAEAGVQLADPIIVSKDISMLELLMLFEDRKVTVALVSSNTIKAKVKNAIFFSRRNLMLEVNGSPLTGLITIKDVFTELAKNKTEAEDVKSPNGRMSKTPKNVPGNIETFETSEKGLLKPLMR